MRKLLGVWRGGGDRWFGRSATGVPAWGGGGGVGGCPNIHNDPCDVLIILNIHKWGKKNFQKKFAHQLKLPSANVRPGGQARG